MSTTSFIAGLLASHVRATSTQLIHGRRLEMPFFESCQRCLEQERHRRRRRSQFRTWCAAPGAQRRYQARSTRDKSSPCTQRRLTSIDVPFWNDDIQTSKTVALASAARGRAAAARQLHDRLLRLAARGRRRLLEATGYPRTRVPATLPRGAAPTINTRSCTARCSRRTSARRRCRCSRFGRAIAQPVATNTATASSRSATARAP